MKTLGLIRQKSGDGLKFKKMKENWEDSMVSSAHYYTSGKHKFTVNIISFTDKAMMIGFIWG
jgi:hypothetical protein